MKSSRAIPVALLLLLSLPLLTGCQSLRRPIQRPVPMNAERWQEDLQYLAGRLPRVHKNLFFKISEPEFRKAVGDLNEAIPHLRDDEIIVGFMRLLTRVGDSHTKLNIQSLARFDFHAYPLGLVWLQDKLIVATTTREHRSLLGARVLKIGDTDVRQAYSLISTIIPHENEAKVKSETPLMLNIPEFLHGLHIIPDISKARFTFEGAGGKKVSLEFGPMRPEDYEPSQWVTPYDAPGVPRPLTIQNQGQYYWFTYLQDSKTLYFKYNHCEEMRGKPFRKFMNELLNFTDTHAVERFVIDLRHNIGGNSEILKPLIAEIQKRPSFNRPGHLFVIIGLMTFSSAVLNAVSLRQTTRAILVGEPTGGKPNGYGDIRTLTLPNSGLEITYSTKYFHVVEGDPPSLMPDIHAESTVKDYFSGRDPKLEAVLAYRPPQASTSQIK